MVMIMSLFIHIQVEKSGRQIPSACSIDDINIYIYGSDYQSKNRILMAAPI